MQDLFLRHHRSTRYDLNRHSIFDALFKTFFSFFRREIEYLNSEDILVLININNHPFVYWDRVIDLTASKVDIHRI